MLGLSGSLVNWLLALGGLALLASGRLKSAAARYFAWLLAAVNGFVAGVYMVASPLVGFGDWMTIFRRFSAQQPLRVVTAAVGLVVTLLWARASARLLARTLVGASSSERGEYALRLVRVSWASGGGLALLAATLSPLGPGWALMIAAGSSFGTTWPLLPVARMAARIEPTQGQPGATAVERDRRWLAAAGLAGGAFVIVFGHGIRLTGG